MLNYYRPPLVVLLETHLADHVLLRDDFHFTSFSQAPEKGQAEGIVVLWNNNIVHVSKIALTNQEIHYMVHIYPQGHSFMPSGIYASHILNNRKLMRQNLMSIVDAYKGHWLMGRDFNDILYSN